MASSAREFNSLSRVSAGSACDYMPLAVEESAIADEHLVDLSLQSESELEGSAMRRPVRRARGVAAAMLGACGTLTGLSLLVLLALPRLKPPPADASVDESMQAFGAFALASSFTNTMRAVTKVMENAEQAYPGVQALGKPTEDLRGKVMYKGVHPLTNLTKYANLTGAANKPGNNRNNGNLCPDDEEQAAGLCYQRCDTITGSKYPIRTGAFSCCENWPCTFFNSVFSNPLNLCAGYDTAGDKEGGNCPHVPGDCFKNEEFNLGMCYKRCSILTQNAFPYRAAADTCCRYNSHLACLDALNTFTNFSLSVGGGEADSDPDTLDLDVEPHAPKLELTEKKAHWS